MKIAWFTPFSQKSAIGGCSYLITNELARLADVEVWCPPAPDLRATDVRTVVLSPEIDLNRLVKYEIVAYNFGNYLGFHKDIFETSRRIPGISILHDFVMHHFFAEYYLEHLRSPESYVQTMERTYGEPGKAVAEQMLAGQHSRVWEGDQVLTYPLFEEAMRGAYGVVVHSEFFKRRVQPVYPGPVQKLYLPHDVEGAGLTLTRRDLDVPEDGTLLVTVGHVNPNKRVLSVIHALGAIPNRAANLTYAICGPYHGGYYDELMAAVKKYGLERVVRFAGYLPDEHLQAYVRHADICVNLRYPATEGASLSAVEEMLHGKALIVTDTGFYGELPDDAVRKINLSNEAEELPRVLAELIGSPETRTAMGQRARAFALEHFRAARYAAEFLQFAREVQNGKPMLQLADRIGAELRQMGVTASMPLVDTVAREMSLLFSGDSAETSKSAEPPMLS